MSPAVALMLILGGFLAVEGALWSLAPGAMRRMLSELLDEAGDGLLAAAGVVSLIIGAGLITAALMMAR